MIGNSGCSRKKSTAHHCQRSLSPLHDHSHPIACLLGKPLKTNSLPTTGLLNWDFEQRNYLSLAFQWTYHCMQW